MTGPLLGDVADEGEQAGSPAGLSAFFEPRPRFRRRLRGYDPADVDDYVAWVEEELQALRQVGGLSDRCSGCSQAASPQVAAPSPLQVSPALPAPSAPPTPVAGSEERDALLLVGAMRELLRLAEERADVVVAEAEAEAERVRASARAEADARLRNVSDLREAAAAAAERLHQEAAQLRAEAAAVRERARRQGEQLLTVAAAERARLDAEAAERRAQEDEAARREREVAAAEAVDRVAAVAREVDDLYRQRDEARESLCRLTGQIGAALDAFAGPRPDDGRAPGRRPGGVVVTGNVVLAEPREPVAT
jgi:DivIVA domain-containing protein